MGEGGKQARNRIHECVCVCVCVCVLKGSGACSSLALPTAMLTAMHTRAHMHTRPLLSSPPLGSLSCRTLPSRLSAAALSSPSTRLVAFCEVWNAYCSVARVRCSSSLLRVAFTVCKEERVCAASLSRDCTLWCSVCSSRAPTRVSTLLTWLCSSDTLILSSPTTAMTSPCHNGACGCTVHGAVQRGERGQASKRKRCTLTKQINPDTRTQNADTRTQNTGIRTQNGDTRTRTHTVLG